MMHRDILAASGVALVAATLFSLPALDRLDGLSIDLLFWLRHQAFGARHAATDSPTVVIAIDEETYQTEPFRNLPKVVWTKQIAQVLDATLAGGAKVVGFDVIFPTSIERFVKGFDRELLISLRRASETDQVVLGKVQHQLKPIMPFRGYSFAIGHSKNIRAVNLFTDDDGVIRRVPLMFTNERGEAETAMALELATRALGQPAERLADGRILLGDRVIPGSRANAMAVNFEGGPEVVPTYSLADLLACAERGDADYFRRHFADKVVLLGAVLDVEDRKLTSKRLMTAPEGRSLPERCAYPVMMGFYAELRRNTIPAVYVHAQAVNDLLRGESLRELGGVGTWGVVLIVTSVVVATTIAAPLSVAGLGTLIELVLWAVLATWAFRGNLVLPLLPSLASTLLAFTALLAYRYVIADKDQRHIRKAFSHYLAPSVVERLVADGRMPAQGGELRDMTVWISDLENYSTYAELLSPGALVDLLNTVYTEISDTVEAHDGFVAQFVGDAVVAAFGAPLNDPDHARHAVESALACSRRVAELASRLTLPEGLRLHIRVGISSGSLLVGNIGSKRRLSYTIVGDHINLASRLEGVNKIYGTNILVNEATVRQCEPELGFREVDVVRVKGRAVPVRIFEPLGGPEPLSEARERDLADFAEALSRFRARQFAKALASFEALAGRDPVAAAFVARAREMRSNPPPEDWDGVNVLLTK